MTLLHQFSFSDQRYTIINKITDNSIVFIASMSIPFNIIIYFALINSEYPLPRYIPPLFGLVAIILSSIRKKIDLGLKIWSFISLLFLTGCYNLLLGLIDIASLWFVLAIIFSLFITKKNEALYVFISSFVIVMFVGILMITRISFIPLNYKFDICQFACVAIRILHFILIASLIYFILKVFFSAIQNNAKDLEVKSEDLANLNIALKNEMIERKNIQEKMMDAVILTEEKERRRLSSDLHDELGPVLSAINLFFQAYIDATDNKHKEEIEQKLKEIIGDAIKDVSRISHNISPHILDNYGLITALEYFIQPIALSEKIQFNLNFCKMKRLNSKEEIVCYRSVTELINNTLKHGKASIITLQIKLENDFLHVYYEDNGKGFDIEDKLRNNSGMGLNNIQNRISSINGKIIFKSTGGSGMKAHIILNLINSVENEIN